MWSEIIDHIIPPSIFRFNLEQKLFKKNLRKKLQLIFAGQKFKPINEAKHKK